MWPCGVGHRPCIACTAARPCCSAAGRCSVFRDKASADGHGGRLGLKPSQLHMGSEELEEPLQHSFESRPRCGKVNNCWGADMWQGLIAPVLEVFSASSVPPDMDVQPLHKALPGHVPKPSKASFFKNFAVVDSQHSHETSWMEAEPEPEEPAISDRRHSHGRRGSRRLSAPPPRRPRGAHRGSRRHSKRQRAVDADKEQSSLSSKEAATDGEPQDAEGCSTAAAVSEEAIDFFAQPPCSDSWEWPLSRQERKARVSMIDWQMSSLDRKLLLDELDVLRNLDTIQWG
mmetsp:Transcript_65332/g.121785  ORF Transcript_65332/g.121785 Transcript_65332/m.121785 type:complete len:287 (+) Transcript_65332:85-945(+)